MNLIVWRVGEWSQIRYGKYANQGTYLRVMFKRRDGEKGTITLNLPEQSIYIHSNDWVPYLKEGNIIDVQLQPNGKNIDYFKPFTVITVKEVNKEHTNG